MMVVMTVMAAALHLIKNLRVDPGACQPASLASREELCLSDRGRRPGEFRSALPLQQFDDALV